MSDLKTKPQKYERQIDVFITTNSSPLENYKVGCNRPHLQHTERFGMSRCAVVNESKKQFDFVGSWWRRSSEVNASPMEVIARRRGRRAAVSRTDKLPHRPGNVGTVVVSVCQFSFPPEISKKNGPGALGRQRPLAVSPATHAPTYCVPLCATIGACLTSFAQLHLCLLSITFCFYFH